MSADNQVSNPLVGRCADEDYAAWCHGRKMHYLIGARTHFEWFLHALPDDPLVPRATFRLAIVEAEIARRV